MGLIDGVWGLIFGGGRNAVVETVEAFRENREKGAQRDIARTEAALAQFAAEFALPKKSLFDRVIDGLNRVPRPAMALGTIGLFVCAMHDPVWFAERMQGVALVPEPLWWLLGAIVSFYFGARHQAKTQDFQRSIAETLNRTAQVAEGLAGMERLRPDEPVTARDIGEERPASNPALAAWRQGGDDG